MALNFKYESSTFKPYIVHFPNPPPANAFDNDDKENKLKFTCVSHKKYTTIVAETEKIEYKGDNLLDETTLTDTSRFLVGVFNKNTNTLQLINTNGIFQLPQKVKNFDESVPEEADSENDTFYAKRVKLTKAFGSSKAAKIVRKNAANAVKNTAAEVFEFAKEHTQVNTMVGTKENGIAVLPPHNTTTTRVSEIYNIDDCVIPMSLEKLDISPFIAMLESTNTFEEQAPVYSKNVVDSLKALLNKKRKEENQEQEGRQRA